jgi:hypothetical protein
MNLPMRQTKKRDQALDAVASLAKTWSEWRLGERASKSVEVGKKKAKKAAKVARKKAKKADVGSVASALKGTPLKVAGAVAVVGGVGAAVAKKLKGGGHAEPLYTPPPAPAPAPVPAAVPAPDMAKVPSPAPTQVVVEDLAADVEPELELAFEAADTPAGEADASGEASEPEAAASDDAEPADKA